jgi:hypothetical protein
MATGNRTLKLSILADVDELKKSLKTGETEVKGFSDKVSDFGKKAAAAFAIAAAAAAAYATKLAVDGVKAAIEDEQAQLRLASALKTATGATDAQIKATEDYISQTSLAVGIADDALRPAFQRLSVATGDVTKSQQLLNLAIDISKGTGKDLGAVTEALSKAYGGQDTQLARLGIGITSAQAKQLSFREETEILSNLYGGAASRNAETFQGRIDRLKVGFEEAKETIGFALLPVIERLIEFIFVYGTPIVDKFRDAFNIIKDALDRNRDSFNEFWILLKDRVFPILQTVFGFLLDVGARAAAAIIDAFGKIVGAITPVLNFIIDAINLVISGLNKVRGGTDIAPIGKIGAGGGFSGGGFGQLSGAGGAVAGAGAGGFGGGGGVGGGAGGGGGAAGGIDVLGATNAKDLVDRLTRVNNAFTDLQFQVITGGISGSAAKKQFDKLTAEFAVLERQAGALVPTPVAFGATPFGQAGGNVYNINVSGAIDPEGTARAVANQLNSQAARSVTALRDRVN